MKERGIARLLIKEFAEKRKSGQISPSADDAFALGMNTMRNYILNMISTVTKGERIGQFDRGQDDGLLWVAQELKIFYDEN
jgi:hypothetical protein